MCGALTARQRARADSTSLNTIALPAAREPGPLVTLLLNRTVAKVDSIGFVVLRWSRWPETAIADPPPHPAHAHAHNYHTD